MSELIIILSAVAFIVAVVVIERVYKKRVKAASREGTTWPCRGCEYGRHYSSDYGSGWICNHPKCPPDGSDLSLRQYRQTIDKPEDEFLWPWPKRMVTDTETGERVWLDDEKVIGVYRESPRTRFVGGRYVCEHLTL